MKTPGKRCARHIGDLGQFFDRPVTRRLFVHRTQSTLNDSVRLILPLGRMVSISLCKPCPQYGRNQQIEQAVQHGGLPRLIFYNLVTQDLNQRRFPLRPAQSLRCS